MSGRYTVASIKRTGERRTVMELKPGDVVMLKSGGHSLCVAEVNEDAVECVWMGHEGELYRETLPVAVLELVESDEEEDDEDEDEEKEEDDEEEDDKVA
jgi:uncharacterized protein YodC (DUF2158 family)